MMNYYDFNKYAEVIVDGAMLVQTHKQNVVGKVVIYTSRLLSDVEQ